MSKTSEGKLHYKKGKTDYKEMMLAKECFEQAIKDGEYDACVYLAAMYNKGQVCDHDLNMSIRLIEQALKHHLELSNEIEQVARRNLGAYYAMLSKEVYLYNSIGKKNKLADKYIIKAENIWKKLTQQGDEGLYKYLCSCYFGRNPDKCYKYANKALEENIEYNFDEYVSILHMRAISYGDLIEENKRLTSKKRQNMKSKELNMLKEVLKYDFEYAAFRTYRCYKLVFDTIEDRYLSFYNSSEKLKYYYKKYLESGYKENEYRDKLISQYKIVSKELIYKVTNSNYNCVCEEFYRAEKCYVDYLTENRVLNFQVLDRSLEILKKIEEYKNSKIESRAILPCDVELGSLDMPTSIFFFFSYDFIKDYRYNLQNESYKTMYNEFMKDLNNPEGYIERRQRDFLRRYEEHKKELLYKQQMQKMQNQIDLMKESFDKQNKDLIKQNESLRKEISKLNENASKLKWDVNYLKFK